MSLTAPEIRTMARGETGRIDIDWGENTAGTETGVLKDGDTVASCAVALDSGPTAGQGETATFTTLGPVTVLGAGTTLYVNERLCTAGEATTCPIVTVALQTYGRYLLRFTVTTTNGQVFPRFVVVMVEAP